MDSIGQRPGVQPVGQQHLVVPAANGDTVDADLDHAPYDVGRIGSERSEHCVSLTADDPVVVQADDRASLR